VKAARTLDVIKAFHMPYVGPKVYMMDVALDREEKSLTALVGTPVKLVYTSPKTGEVRETTVLIEGVAPPLPDHMPPYRLGERIGLQVTIEGKLNGSGA
jgi:hypothetical protein